MTSEILRMRFAHYLGEFEDDEGFLQATYQAGIQVQRLKTLEKAREAQKGAPKDDQRKDSSNKEDSGKKDGQNKERQGNARKTKEIRQNTE